MLRWLAMALEQLAGLRDEPEVAFGGMVKATVLAFEALGRDSKGSLAELYAEDAGQKLAEFLRGLAGATAGFEFQPGEWPEVVAALIGPETVKPSWRRAAYRHMGRAGGVVDERRRLLSAG